MIDGIEKDGPPQRGRLRALQTAIALTIFAAYVAWAWSSVLGGFGGDNAIYLLSAQYLSPFSDHSAVSAAFFKSGPYPPLYPLVLAMTGGGQSLLSAHLVTATCLIVALYLLYRWQRALALSRAEATAISALIAMVPGVYLQSLEILSENLYLCLTLLALFSYERANTSSGNRWLAVTALAVASAMLTRTAGVALLAAFVVHLLSKKRSKAIIFAIIALFPPLLWHLLGNHSSYAGSFMRVYAHDPVGSVVAHIGDQMRALGYGWVGNFSSSRSLGTSIPALLIGGVALAGLLVRLREWKFDAVYVAFYLLILLVWPFPGEAERFMVVILPILFVHGFLLLRRVRRAPLFGAQRPVADLLFLAVISIIVLPQLVLTASRFAQSVPEQLVRFKRTPGWYQGTTQEGLLSLYSSYAITSALESARGAVPAGNCVLSIKPSVTAYYVGVMSMSPPLSSVPEPDFRRQLETEGCHYLMMFGFSSPTFREPFYPYERLKDRLTVLQAVSFGDRNHPVAMLARLNVSSH